MKVGFWFLFVALVLLPFGVRSDEADGNIASRVHLGSQMMASLQNERDFGAASNPWVRRIDTSASTVRLGYDAKILNEYRVDATLGWVSMDGEWRTSAATVAFAMPGVEASLGEMRLNNSLLTVPLLRETDFLEYTQVSNAFATSTMAQIYGKSLIGRSYFGSNNSSIYTHLAQRVDDTAANAGFNTVIVGYDYRQSQDNTSHHIWRRLSAFVDGQRISPSKWMYALAGSFDVNVYQTNDSRLSLSMQSIVNLGVHDADLSTSLTRARSDSITFVSSLRYTPASMSSNRWQSAMSFGIKDYTQEKRARQWSVAPSMFYHLTRDVSVMAQTMYTRRDPALGSDDMSALLGVRMNLEVDIKTSAVNSGFIGRSQYFYSE